MKRVFGDELSGCYSPRLEQDFPRSAESSTEGGGGAAAPGKKGS